MPSTVVMLAPSTEPTGHRQELMAVNLSLPGQVNTIFMAGTTSGHAVHLLFRTLKSTQS